MRRPWEDMHERLADLDKRYEAVYAREERLLQVTADFYAKQEKAEIAGLAGVLEGAQVGSENLMEFFRAQEAEARQRVETVTPLLQLSDDELEFINREKLVITAIDPCRLVAPSSPVWKCSFLAASCGCSKYETADASASCTCTPAHNANEFNMKAEAYGQGANGWRYARAKCWFDFDIPARPAAANVTIYVWTRVHGFHILRTATASAGLRLELSAEASQYGYSWGSASKRPVDLTTDTMGRYDKNVFLQFMAPMGADPFTVRVTAELQAQGKSGGALAVGDFSTGNGNFVDVPWVNTYG